MKAYRYFITIIGGIYDGDHDKMIRIEEIVIPDLRLAINEKGIFLAEHIGARLEIAEYKKEIKLPPSIIGQLRGIKLFKETEAKLVDKFNFKKEKEI